MIKRKMMAAACAALMMVSVYGCGASSSSTVSHTVESQTAKADETEAAEETNVGKITEIAGTEVTVAMGELSDRQKPQGEAPEKPKDASQDKGDMKAPEKPSEEESGSTIPEKPDGSENSSANTENESKDTKGERPEKSSGDNGMSKNGGPGSSFTENGETVTLDLSQATITKEGADQSETLTVDDLSVDDILTWEMDGDTVTVVIVKHAGRQDTSGSNPGQDTADAEQGTAATANNTDEI